MCVTDEQYQDEQDTVKAVSPPAILPAKQFAPASVQLRAFPSPRSQLESHGHWVRRN